ncbi:HutD family protein [Streptacidiphilus sp. PB12-B1b]|uniref:HutD/Ves family protein n=1 Tax=Streptacidiphilus sp. PB12-B1b TaxID=2705012 RepID=UPI0015FB5002|nr:HutD family protein [Streptacidiphilus sp. PB12-B1b]QMU77494.1 HutD family protein [Streptacidiphilus sp. PB12-B1b]
MAAVRVLRAAERAAAPWKNGGGVTREVAAFPEGSDLGGFQWRVSLADVAQGGPFSAFPGVDRVITVVRGAGMVLTVDGVEHRVDARYRPFAFPGDADTGCRLLQGPLVDFNVMTRRGGTDAVVAVVEREPVALTGPTVLAVVLEGEAELGPDGTLLGPLDAVLLEDGGADGPAAGPARLLDVRGVAAVVTFRPAG